MRLRPSGEAGPIASHFAGFARYQSESAWTWEHMALTRARPVAGDAGLCQRISETLVAVLRSPRDPEQLLIDVAAMRRRIAEDNPRPSPWDLRNRRGGLIDLEFIVQYLVLRRAAASPQILSRRTTEAIDALGKAGLLPPGAQHELGEAAALFRNVQSVLALLTDGLPPTAVLAEPDAAALAACAGAIDFARLDADITAAAARVSGWYDRLIEQPARQAAQARGDGAR
jgi:glutamate-ammonia-ligase adenylyltransferase